MKTFKAKKKGLIKYLLLIFLLLPFTIFVTPAEGEHKQLLTFVILLFPFLLLLWIYFTTVYEIESNYLHYKSGFIKGKIDIRTIYLIEKNKTKWAGFKIALSTGGLVLHYENRKQIYIAPESNDELTGELLRINKSIEIRTGFGG